MGGGGSSSSRTNVYNNLSMHPITNVDLDVDIDKLAQAIKDGNLSEAQAAEAQRKIDLARLQLDEKNYQIEMDNNQIEKDSNALELRKQLSTEAAIKNLTEDAKQGLKFTAAAIGGYLIYKELFKKGKK